jgi:hypothetical protein
LGATPTLAATHAEYHLNGGRRPWAAKIFEENGRDLAESFLSAVRNGDWRAADALMNRIYGRPEAALVAHVPPNPAVEVIRSLPLDEKLELLRRLQDGEFVSTASALPVVEPAPPAG